jgi:HK97 family phage major capsid protein
MAEAAQSRHAIDLTAPEFREMRRAFTVDRSGIDKTARTVPLSFASEQPVERWFGREILEITPQACDLSRLNNGGAVLMDHNWRDQVGVVIETSIDPATKKARCVAKFSQSVRGQEIFNDIVDGIRSLVSVGYLVKKMVLQSVEGDVETHRVTEWQPFEVSVVAVPADTSVGVGRSAKPETPPAGKGNAPAATANRTSPKMETTPAASAATTPVVTSVNDIAAERSRVKDINASARVLAEKHPDKAEAFRLLASKCAETGDGMDAFNRSALDILGTQSLSPVRQDPKAAQLGLSGKEVKRYSLMRAIQCQLAHKPLDGFEGECNRALTEKLDRQPVGFFIPDEIAADRRSNRALSAGVPGDGGYTVGENILASEFVSFLRSNAVVVKLGARVISGLTGDVSIPRQLTGATAYWVSETGSITSSGATFGQIVGKPRRIGTSVPYTKQFLAQTSLDAESFVVNDSDEATAVELDRVAIRGGGGSEPLGILSLASGDRSTSVTFGGAATWAKYLEFFKNVADSKALLGRPAYLTSPASAVKAMSIPKFTSTSNPIWDENSKIGMFPAEWSNNIATSGSGTLDQVIFGDFSQIIFLEWAGRDVVVDPYGTNATGGTVTITIQRLIDMVIRRAKSFAISADTGAA